MNKPVERFTTDTLLLPEAPVRVMRPVLSDVAVHWHDFYELCLVVSGSAVHVLNGERTTVQAGSAFLLSPADFHELSAEPGDSLDCFNVVIDPRLMDDLLTQLGRWHQPAFPWTTDCFHEALPTFERLAREAKTPPSAEVAENPPPERRVADVRGLGAEALTNALVTCLLVDLARKRSRQADWDLAGAMPTTEVSADIQQALLYVDRHFRESLTLAEVAAQAHLSPNYFSERFRAVTGTSYQSYLQSRRLRFARSLLRSTDASVTEVCLAAGFNNLSHFGRAYRRAYGETPSHRGLLRP